jgi:hypothetical protein
MHVADGSWAGIGYTESDSEFSLQISREEALTKKEQAWGQIRA